MKEKRERYLNLLREKCPEILPDITDLLRTEEDERIRAMFDAIPLACTFWDEEGNVVDCNQEAVDLFEVASKEELCRRFSEFSPALQADGSISQKKIKENFWETYTNGDIKFQWLHRSAGGNWLPCYVNLVRIKYREGYRVVGYTRDLRDIQELEDKRRRTDERNRELEVQNRAAKVASEEKSKFLASVSHEIRTPMNAIIGMSDLIRTDNFDETQKSFFEDIQKMSKTLLQIINDILDISKIEAGRMELVPVHFNFVELFDNVCSLNRFSAETRDLEFRRYLDPQLPQVIYGDDVRIRQVLTNVLNNAIKYTREGYVEFRAEGVRRNGGDFLVFSVRDTGIGIRKEDFSKLFGAFRQLDGSANRNIMGTGLGLAITKKLVTMMGGEIIFDSEYGKGSVFTVFLPLTAGDSEKVERRGLKTMVMAGDGVSALVVDDNRINLKVALAFLAAHNIRADTAWSGMEAIEKIKARAYDIVFMDHMMPGMDGVEAVRRIRALAEDGGEERFKTMPVIALSANAVSDARETFFAAGMNDFIAKPIDAADLNLKLARWLPAEKIAGFDEAPQAHAQTSGIGKPGKPGSPGAEAGALDRAAGLRNTGNDQGLYRRLCAAFCEDHGDDFAKLRNALAAGDQELAHRVAHTLKSAARLIGAEQLGRTAAVIEKGLAENNPEFRGEISRLERELRELLAELAADKAAESAKAAPAPGVAAGGPARHLSAEAAGLCLRLEPLLKSGNTRSFEFLEDIAQVLTPLDGAGENLVKQIGDFDFPAALNTLREIRRRLEAQPDKGA
jgi:signal transduction histidine kinase/CheY-like chemotaxis protein/HPt (histidine-containing phosphotransfer) domain-containing protein